MKKYIKGIIVCLLMVIAYILLLMTFGYESNTIKNKKNKIEITNKPRLEDDYYDYINYDKLSKVLIDEEKDYYASWSFAEESYDEIEEKKKEIIDDIVSKCNEYESNSINDKICKTYNSFKNMNYSDNKTIISEYIKLIESSKNIEEYLKNIGIVNSELLDSNILFSISANMDKDGNIYPAIGTMFFSYDNTNNIYKAKGEYQKELGYIKNTDLKLLENYGYSRKEAKKIISNIYPLFEKITKFTSYNPYSEYESISYDELKGKYKNINFDIIKDNYNKLFNTSTNEVIIEDNAQIKLINEYLVNDNLEVLKDYAIIRILYEYGKFIDDKNFDVLEDLDINIGAKEEKYRITKEEYLYDLIYSYYSDSISIEFSKKYNLEKAKDFYTKLINDIVSEYKNRINNETWLSDETKNNAIKKLDKLSIYVLTPDKPKENDYIVNGNNIFELFKNIDTSMNRMIFSSLDNGYLSNDWLTINAFYSPNENSIYIEEGIVYGLHNYLGIDSNNLENDYYKVIGSIGAVIGHEISHGFDNNGSKYDENGKENDWWTEEDKLNYNKLILKVEKYYDNYKQDGYNTLGENIADLGGVSVIIDLANSNNANNDNFKELFESYAKIWASQFTTFYKSYMLENDVHSLNKTRTNAVLSSIDKFYEVYNIKETDKMYVKKEDRVSVW